MDVLIALLRVIINLTLWQLHGLTVFFDGLVHNISSLTDFASIHGNEISGEINFRDFQDIRQFLPTLRPP